MATRTRTLSEGAATKDGKVVRKSRRGKTRKEAILQAAAGLFRRNGFHATGIDEIGAAVGITGPAVYRHFESKQDVLAAIVERALVTHQDIVEYTRRMDAEPIEALGELVTRSAEALVDNRDVAHMYFQESRSLSDDDRARFDRVQRQLITGWIDLLVKVRPELGREEARIVVRATAGVLNSVGYFTTTLEPRKLSKLLASMAMAAMLSSDVPGRKR